MCTVVARSLQWISLSWGRSRHHHEGDGRDENTSLLPGTLFARAVCTVHCPRKVRRRVEASGIDSYVARSLYVGRILFSLFLVALPPDQHKHLERRGANGVFSPQSSPLAFARKEERRQEGVSRHWPNLRVGGTNNDVRDVGVSVPQRSDRDPFGTEAGWS